MVSQPEFSDYCQEDTDVAIGSNDVGSPAPANSITDVHDCRTYCNGINGASHFTFVSQSGQSWGNCFCKSANTNINTMMGAVSGKVVCTATTTTTPTSSSTTTSATSIYITTTLTTTSTTPTTTSATTTTTQSTIPANYDGCYQYSSYGSYALDTYLGDYWDNSPIK